MAANLVFKFLANDKGLRDGIGRSRKELNGLQKTTQGVAKGMKMALGGLGLAYGLSQTVTFVKESVKAAQEDILSQKMLARQLRVTIGATKAQREATEEYISKLSLQTGIVDDKLRPAYATLIRVTGNSKKAQELLNISLDTAAGTGKDLEIVTKSIGRAYLGNVTGLQRLVPGIKKGTNAMAFLKKNFKDARKTLADPFERAQVATDELKEQFGKLLLPEVMKFVDYMTKSVVPAVKKFLDEIKDPRSQVGKVFKDIKKAVGDTVKTVQDFFAVFGNGDAVTGFGNVAKSLVQALPALAALKGILVLAQTGKALANLAAAVGLIRGKGGSGGTNVIPAGGKGRGKGMPFQGWAAASGGIAGSTALVLSLSGDTMQTTPEQLAQLRAAEKRLKAKRKKSQAANQLVFGAGGFGPGGSTANNYTINVNKSNMSPADMVRELQKYQRTTGKPILKK